jgi:NAD+ diphosphatase
MDAPGTRFIPVWGSRVLVSHGSEPRPILLALPELDDLRRQAEAEILLGEVGERTYFALGLGDDDREPPAKLAALGARRDLRRVVALLGRQEAALLAYAKAMTHWHHRHRFCGDCGSPTRSIHGGHLRLCSNPRCGQQHFPRTDPAIIVLVTRGERCLLGRQAAWPPGRYSIIAGFVEPGENLETAVAREVWEETGVEVGEVHYHASQPWPFPSSLMLGFTARAVSTSIRLNDGELEDARWLSRDEIVSELSRGTLRLPPDVSISYRLIEDWFDARGSTSLRHCTAKGGW